MELGIIGGMVWPSIEFIVKRITTSNNSSLKFAKEFPFFAQNIFSPISKRGWQIQSCLRNRNRLQRQRLVVRQIFSQTRKKSAVVATRRMSCRISHPRPSPMKFRNFFMRITATIPSRRA